MDISAELFSSVRSSLFQSFPIIKDTKTKIPESFPQMNYPNTIKVTSFDQFYELNNWEYFFGDEYELEYEPLTLDLFICDYDGGYYIDKPTNLLFFTKNFNNLTLVFDNIHHKINDQYQSMFPILQEITFNTTEDEILFDRIEIMIDKHDTNKVYIKNKDEQYFIRHPETKWLKYTETLTMSNGRNKSYDVILVDHLYGYINIPLVV